MTDDMQRDVNKTFFNGKCPYTDKPCEDWNCNECKVEQEEREYLKPCPFCGGMAIEEISNYYPTNRVYCVECKTTTIYKKTIEEARELWNRRIYNG